MSAESERAAMEEIVFIGLQGSGKTSFYEQKFSKTHVHISLDLFKTRFREQRFLDTCVATEQRFVVDNTNPTSDERARYIAAAKSARFKVTGYYFQSKVDDCLLRNTSRPESCRVPNVAIFATAAKLQIPSLEEGFDCLYYVSIRSDQFIIEAWQNDAPDGNGPQDEI